MLAGVPVAVITESSLLLQLLLLLSLLLTVGIAECTSKSGLLVAECNSLVTAATLRVCAI